MRHYTVHGILQARILEWIAVPFSRGSSQPSDWTQISCIADILFTSWVTGKPKNTGVGSLSLLQRIFLTQESNRGLLHCRQKLYQLSYQERLSFNQGHLKGHFILAGALKQNSSCGWWWLQMLWLWLFISMHSSGLCHILTIALHSITKQSGEISEFCNRGKYVGIRRIPYSKCFPSLRVRNELVQIWSLSQLIRQM